MKKIKAVLRLLWKIADVEAEVVFPQIMLDDLPINSTNKSEFSKMKSKSHPNETDNFDVN